MASPSKAWLWAGSAVLALIAIWGWRQYDLGALLTLDILKVSRDALEARVQTRPLATTTLFFAVYVAATAVSIPGAVVLTLAAGAMFGLGWGLVLVFPFWLINLLIGLTPMGAARSCVVSRLGILAGTAVHVNAGTQLAAIQWPGAILSSGLLAEYVLAIKHGLGLNKILGTIRTYATLAEANQCAAGEWKRAHSPPELLEWVGRYHAWERA